MTTTYTPQTGSAASQVCGYLQNNLHDSLTLDDITDMFGGVRGNVHTLMAKAVEAKLLTRDRNADGEYIYQPGPALPKAGVDIDAIHTKRPSARWPPPPMWARWKSETTRCPPAAAWRPTSTTPHLPPCATASACAASLALWAECRVRCASFLR